MLNLAQHHNNGEESVILRDVSDEEEISIRYLEQIIIPLKINRLVKSIRGAGGGYLLARDPSEIKLSEVLHALEGPCCLVECVEDSDLCNRMPICTTYEIWKEASNLLKNYFESITIQDLVNIAEKKKAKAKTKTKDH
jgi:Rrf2 family protein